MRTRRPYVQIDPDELERIRQIDLLTYLREFEPSNVEEVKGTTNVYRTVDHDSLKISNGKWFWWSQGFGCLLYNKIPQNCRGDSSKLQREFPQ